MNGDPWHIACKKTGKATPRSPPDHRPRTNHAPGAGPPKGEPHTSQDLALGVAGKAPLPIRSDLFRSDPIRSVPVWPR